MPLNGPAVPLRSLELKGLNSLYSIGRSREISLSFAPAFLRYLVASVTWPKVFSSPVACAYAGTTNGPPSVFGATTTWKKLPFPLIQKAPLVSRKNVGCLPIPGVPGPSPILRALTIAHPQYCRGLSQKLRDSWQYNRGPTILDVDAASRRTHSLSEWRLPI